MFIMLIVIKIEVVGKRSYLKELCELTFRLIQLFAVKWIEHLQANCWGHISNYFVNWIIIIFFGDGPSQDFVLKIGTTFPDSKKKNVNQSKTDTVCVSIQIWLARNIPTCVLSCPTIFLTAW